MSPRVGRTLKQFGPSALVVAALFAHVQLRPFIAGKTFLFLYPAVFFGSMLGGWRAALAAHLLAVLGAWYFIVPPSPPLALSEYSDAFGLITFLMIGIAFSLFSRRSEEIKRRLIKTEDRFRGLMQFAPDAILIVGGGGLIEGVNPQVERWFGYEASELIGQPVEILIPDRYRGEHVRKREGFAHHPHSRPMGAKLDLYARRKDGSEFPIDVSLSPAIGEPSTVIAALRDITEQKKRHAEESFYFKLGKTLAESIHYEINIAQVAELIVPDFADWCLVYGKDHSGKPRLHSAGHVDRCKSALLDDLLKGEVTLQEFPLGVSETISSGKPYLVPEVCEELLKRAATNERAHMLYGEIGVRSYVVLPLRAHEKNWGGIVFGYGDSDRRFTEDTLPFYEEVARTTALAIAKANLYQEAQEATRIREDVLSTVSHDLKNPLFAILLGLQILSRVNPSEEKVKALLQKTVGGIERSARMMEGLIMSILDFAKMKAGTFTLSPTRESVSSIIEDLQGTLDPLATMKSIEIDWEIESELPKLSCDRLRVEQVLSNFIGNAIKFTPDGGKISVNVDRDGENAHFSVRDTGPGIPPEQIPRLFEGYWQAKETSRLGNGLGLSIAKGIIEAHRGRVWVESEIGKGSTFHFTLPLPSSIGLSLSATAPIESRIEA